MEVVYKVFCISINNQVNTFNNTDYVLSWKYKGLSAESIKPPSSHNNDPTLKNCLFGAVTLTKNVDIDKYKYFGYGIGFDRKSSFSFSNEGFGQNIIIFGLNMSSFAHIDNKKRYSNSRKRTNTKIRTYLNRRKMYSINFTVTRKKICLSLHYNGANSILVCGWYRNY